MENTSATAVEPTVIITAEAMLEHWQGHRRLTRRIIETFPEKELFGYSVGGMRPFAELAREMIGMAAPGMKGIVTGKWGTFEEAAATIGDLKTKQDLLNRWDEVTEEINKLWPQVPANRFAQVDKAFGMYENPVYATLLYFIDNEIHHRGQGYVYLRSLGIEPPPFWER